MRPAEAKLNFQKLLDEKLSSEKFDINENADPQANFDILQDIMTSSHSASFTKKRVRCDRRKVAKLPWVTKGIIRSIKTRNKLYKKFKNTKQSSEQYTVLKLQLKNFKKYLKIQ